MVKRFFLFSLKKMIAAMLVPIVILGIAFYAFVSNYMTGALTAHNQSLIHQSEQICNLMFQAFDTINVTVSSSYQMASTLKNMSRDGRVSLQDNNSLNTLHRSVVSICAACSYIDSAYIYLYGMPRFYASTQRLVPLDASGDGEWMQQVAARAVSPVVFRQMPAPVGGRPRNVMSILQPAFSGFHSIDGIVIVNADIDRMRAYARETSALFGQQVYLLTAEGAASLTDDQPLDEALRAEATGRGEEEWVWVSEGESFLINTSDMQRYGLTFMAMTSMRSIQSAQRTIALVVLVAMAVGLSAAAFISYFYARGERRNMQRIVEAIDLARRGEEMPPGPPGGSDVFAYITHSIMESGLLNRLMQMDVKEKQLKLQLLESRMLQYQINPHFQINTLRTIYWKIVEQEGIHSPTAQMVENMLDFVGYILADTRQETTLGEEVRHTRSFCEILEARHRDEVAFTWAIDEGLEAAVVDKLILQPYIENAFYHGLRNAPGRKSIAITIRRAGKDILIHITDDGRGMTPQRLAQVREWLQRELPPAGHIGLCNPHRRIVIKHGEAYGVTVDSAPETGTRVTIRIPYRAGALATERNDTNAP